MELVDVDAMVKAVIRSLQLDIEDAGAVVTCTGLPSVRAERLELMQLFSNLLSNALKYRKPGVPAVIAVGAERANEGSKTARRGRGS